MTLHDDIVQQPQVIRMLLESQRSVVVDIAREIQRREPCYVFLAARGTSDNAARYAQYLWGAYNNLPIALATPSLFTLYNNPPKLREALVIGVSQSGQSPDIVSVLAEGRKQGCMTVAVTNTPDSPLAGTADFVVDTRAGVERAVAATKTYTSQLAALAMLSVALHPDSARQQALESVPGWMEDMLALDERIGEMAQRYRYMEQCVVIGRGYNYSTAFEWSLKLKELTYIGAEPYSSADFRHGPIAVVEQGYPVMAVAPGGKVYKDLLELLRRLQEERHAELMVVSDQDEALDLAHSPVRLPPDIPEWVSPLVTIVPGQLFAYHLTLAKGFDTDAPRGLRKVTETK